MDEKVDPQTIKRRSAVLRSISERKKLEYYEKFIGREVEVLFETGDEGYWTGYTDNYIRVSVASKELSSESAKKVKLTETAADFVMGELV